MTTEPRMWRTGMASSASTCSGGRAAPVTAPAGIGLGGFERIRRHRDALVGVQVLPDGSRRVVRLQLKGDRAVTDAMVIDASLSDTGSTFATVSGDDRLLPPHAARRLTHDAECESDDRGREAHPLAIVTAEFYLMIQR